ncbi:HAD family hydrolase [Actinokineospora auranticolor]|uniref:Putative hydrolase of the HAD superfamily n=1 Tax=Actinokineospora auranticolor TaxID=155976 RepID=A0A2S6GWJ7_9PSEU|nr:HAD family hydrolase [Actinokineospora auranticolor]PPK69594.1 putative hydrolase of the HAD superfamily [Actinokineospora auranticolor]
MRAVIFDWGGTLTPWVTMDHLAAWRAYADIVHPGDAEASGVLAAALLAAEDEAWGRVRVHHTAFHLTQVLESAGAPPDEAALAAFRTYWDPATRTDPEVAPMLGELRERGLRTGVLSSTAWPGAWHEEVLHRDGVGDLFDGLVWSSDLAYTKPHRVAFEAAMAAVGVDDPADCVYVGDRPYDDISGAQAVGMRTIFIPHSDIPLAQQVAVDVVPDAVVQRMSELPAVLDRWLDGRNPL